MNEIAIFIRRDTAVHAGRTAVHRAYTGKDAYTSFDINEAVSQDRTARGFSVSLNDRHGFAGHIMES